MNIIITLGLLDNLNLFYNPQLGSIKGATDGHRSSFDNCQLTVHAVSTSEFDCCQGQIIGKWISILIMKQTEMAQDLLTKFKGRQHQSQISLVQPTFFFWITLW